MTLVASDKHYSLLKVSFSERMDEIGSLRIRAWRDELGVDPAFFAKQSWVEPLDFDPSAHHWVVVKDEEVVAAARISFHQTPDTIPYSALLPDSHRPLFRHKQIASINRLVVEPQCRGYGLSKLLDQVRIEAAIGNGSDLIVAESHSIRLASLKKLGFSYICELPSTPEMPHRPLYLMLYQLT